MKGPTQLGHTIVTYLVHGRHTPTVDDLFRNGRGLTLLERGCRYFRQLQFSFSTWNYKVIDYLYIVELLYV